MTEDIQSGHYRILHPGTVHRRSALHIIGGYNARLKSLEDSDIFLSLATVGRLVNVGEPLIYYRRMHGSESRKTPEFAALAKDFLLAKSRLLKEGLSVSLANDKLAQKIEALEKVPRLLPKSNGAYQFEMAQAFEVGQLRRRAFAEYLSAMKNGARLKDCLRGLLRVLMPQKFLLFLRLIMDTLKKSTHSSNKRCD